MPDAPGLELLRGEIEQDHPGAVVDTGFDTGQASLVVDPEQIIAVLGWLREAPAHEYRFLSSLHAADYLPAAPRFGIHYELLNRDRVERLRVKAMLEEPAAPAVGPVAKEGASPLPGTSAGEGPTPTPPAEKGSGLRGNVAEDPPGRADAGGPAGPSLSPPAGPGAEHLPEIDSCVELFPTAEFQEREVYDFFGIVFRGHPDLTRILLPEDYVGWPLRRDFPIGGEPVTFTYNEGQYG